MDGGKEREVRGDDVEGDVGGAAGRIRETGNSAGGDERNDAREVGEIQEEVDGGYERDAVHDEVEGRRRIGASGLRDVDAFFFRAKDATRDAEARQKAREQDAMRARREARLRGLGLRVQDQRENNRLRARKERAKRQRVYDAAKPMRRYAVVEGYRPTLYKGGRRARGLVTIVDSGRKQ